MWEIVRSWHNRTRLCWGWGLWVRTWLHWDGDGLMMMISLKKEVMERVGL